ncbi:MAG: polyphosphate glucokinase [Dokdonia sp.]|jgi:polyphosphate glucokinase
MQILGIDIGGTGIKGAPVDLEKENYLGERFRIPTPQPATPEAVAECVQQLIDHFDWKGPVGVGFPTVIVNGQARAYGNMHKSWLNVQIDKLFEEKTGLPFTVINDADAAALAEMRFGVGKGKKGLVAVITVGTGIGSGLFYNGQLIPNFELGRMQYKGEPIETYAANSTRKREELSYEEWGERFDFFLKQVEHICIPDHYIIGGGISKHIDTFRHILTTKVPLDAAKTKNHAGIIGAAFAAMETSVK